MIKRYDGNKLIKVIPFEQISFRTPYSDTSKKRPSEKAFMSGITAVPGIYIVKYTNQQGVTRYYFRNVKHSILSSSFCNYRELVSKGIMDVQYAYFPAPIEAHQELITSLRWSFMHMRLDSHYERLEPWVMRKRNDIPPLDLFSFRPVFTFENGSRNFNFNDYRERSGVYIIRKHGSIIKHIGQSLFTMSDTLRNHFYRNPSVDYSHDVHTGCYDVTIIEIPLKIVKNVDSLEKLLNELEILLVKWYDPEDNVEGKRIMPVAVSDGSEEENYF